MKTLNSIFLTFILVTAFSALKAKPVPGYNDITINFSINTYVDAITRGKTQGLNDAIDMSATFSMLKGQKILSFTRDEMVAFMKDNNNIELNCTTSTTIMQRNGDFTVIKVDMQFDDFVRTNYVTIANTGKGWKITNVYSVFK